MSKKLNFAVVGGDASGVTMKVVEVTHRGLYFSTKEQSGADGSIFKHPNMKFGSPTWGGKSTFQKKTDWASSYLSLGDVGSTFVVPIELVATVFEAMNAYNEYFKNWNPKPKYNFPLYFADKGNKVFGATLIMKFETETTGVQYYNNGSNPRPFDGNNIPWYVSNAKQITKQEAEVLINPPKTFKCGDQFRNDYGDYILAQVGISIYTLINLENGNRLTDPTFFNCQASKVPESFVKQLFGTSTNWRCVSGQHRGYRL